ncbi:MAG: nitric oxide reductase activation protein NorD [Oscillospiraceae bacterium]|nr:nitric oxide reductase activation protein NorD [Oscillospiraceae bacterium]
MARVNHKLVKQRLNEKRSKISDRQFFTSRLLAGHFEDMAAAQTRRYHYQRRIHVNLIWQPKNPSVANTDNQYITINAGHPFVTKTRGRENRYRIVCGLFAHELGHDLYTDFLAEQTYTNRLESFGWFPSPPLLTTVQDRANEAKLWDYLKEDPKQLEAAQILAHHITNVVEDGYIENRMLTSFPGTLGTSLSELREIHYESLPTVSEMIEREENGDQTRFETELQLLLSYAKFGQIKYGDTPLTDPRIQTVFGLITTVDEALMQPSGKERLLATSQIMVRCWPELQEYLELVKQRQQEAADAGEDSGLEELLKKLLGGMAGASTPGSGSSSPVFDPGSTVIPCATMAQRSKTQEEAESSTEAEESAGTTPQTETESEDGISESGEENSASGQSGAAPDSSGMPGAPMSGPGGGKQAASETEKGRIPLQQTRGLSEPTGGTTEFNDNYAPEDCDTAAANIARILDQMAEKAACQELESERLQELNDVAQSLSYGNIHEGVSIRVNRIKSVDETLIEQYQTIAPPLLTISRQLQKSLLQQLKDSRRGGKQTGLLMGRRLDTHALHRNDGKVFYKNNLPNEIPQLTVGLLLDESGSMCSCDRCTYARAAAIILYDFCQSLDIPVMVYGHSTGYSSGSGSTVELYSYAEFDSFDNDDRYRLIDISARSSNRDGAALRYVAERLSRRPEPVKLLILVSDGQPADTGYYGTAAEEDLRGIKHEYQRKGILFVAAAIGDDKENIERIYGDSFLDITDLNLLPSKLTSVVKKHLRF